MVSTIYSAGVMKSYSNRFFLVVSCRRLDGSLKWFEATVYCLTYSFYHKVLDTERTCLSWWCF